MALFGSGGHSSEMLMLIRNAKLADKLNNNQIDRLICVISNDDQLISDKLKAEFVDCQSRLEIVKLRRAREVGQSYLSSIVTTLLGILSSFHLILEHRPKLCVTNGPAIGVTISVAIRLLQISMLGLFYHCQIVYIESFCRTRTLSLTGRILYHLRLANKFYVQWPKLANDYPRASFRGLLV